MSKKNEFTLKEWDKAESGDILSIKNVRAIILTGTETTARIKILDEDINTLPKDIIVISKRNVLFSIFSIRTNDRKTDFFLEEDDEIIFNDIIVVDNGSSLSYIVKEYEET